MWITQAKETRQLQELEKLLRDLLTQRLLSLDKLKEIKWKQRAKRQWINEGDKNTRFFHAVASQQKRNNVVSSMMLQEVEYTEHSVKAKAFFDFFADLIRRQESARVSFDLQAIYTNQVISQAEVSSLLQPWIEEEIRQAINSWKSNKWPGPDGFTGEFYNLFIDILLPDLKDVFTKLNQEPHGTLHPLNDSFIILVPKKEPALIPNDYRPISLVNGVQKIYSKIMANKLKPMLENLLYPSQTGFLNQRSILHGFHYAQQLVQSAARQNEQVAIFKADIFKAFDTLSWQFIISSLHARGFPAEWIQCVKNNVLLGQSRVLLNSVTGKPIRLKRGVRQGDPMSPYLFNIAIDLLPRWIKRLNELNFLLSPFPQCIACLLYADDTLIFLKPTADQAIRIKILFQIFGQLSGLKLNSLKSKLAITSAPSSLGQSLADIIQCKAQAFPIKYLGLPLSDKRLFKSDYSSILDIIEKALAR